MFRIEMMAAKDYNMMMCGESGYTVQTILIDADDEQSAISKAKCLHPNFYINENYVRKV